MTANQINYLKLQEERSHNRATEGTELGKLKTQQQSLSETIRHNQAQEGVSWYDTYGRVRYQDRMAGASERQADTAQYRADTDRGKVLLEQRKLQVTTPGSVFKDFTSGIVPFIRR